MAVLDSDWILKYHSEQVLTGLGVCAIRSQGRFRCRGRRQGRGDFIKDINFKVAGSRARKGEIIGRVVRVGLEGSSRKIGFSPWSGGEE